MGNKSKNLKSLIVDSQGQFTINISFLGSNKVAFIDLMIALSRWTGPTPFELH